MQLLPRREIIKVVDKIKIKKEDFTYTTDYIWCMEVVVLFSMTTEGCAEGCVSHLAMIIWNIGFFLFITFNSQMVAWVISQWLDFIWVSLLFSAFDSQMVVWVIWKWLHLILGSFSFITLNSQMVVWVICQWFDSIWVSFYFLLLTHRWVCE